MSFKNPKNLIVIISVIAALTAGTVLLGGYANSKPAATEAPAKEGCCPATGSGCCPMMAGSAGCQKMMAAQAESTGCSETPCTTDCPKPCCAEGSEGCCDNPCPVPCPKPCCAEGGCCNSTGCQKTAAETKAQ